MMFGGLRVDAALARELIRAVEPMAIEAAQQAERRTMERHAEHRRILELELQQARYEASLAERRYAACDPDNRLIAATLEKNWEAALRRVRDGEARLEATITSTPTPAMPDLSAITEDLEAAWKNASVTMRSRQQGPGGHSQHGEPVVRPGYRRHPQPDGIADRTGQDLDGKPGRLHPARPRYSRL